MPKGEIDLNKVHHPERFEWPIKNASVFHSVTVSRRNRMTQLEGNQLELYGSYGHEQ